ncbi:MAG: mechanosensitive ion channel family protein [Deferribacteraceae bacterium]|jgi:small-conductance mechanosensitive channel|nr:mechanosensitive ion channel family protein [Deferribacteraceae bacterium]
MDKIILGNSVEHYLKGFGIFIAMIAGIYLILKLLNILFGKLFKRSKHKVLRVFLRMDKYLSPVLQYFPIYFLTLYFNMHDRVRQFLSAIWFAVLSYAVIKFLSEVIKIALTDYGAERLSIRPTLLKASINLSIGLLYLFGLLFVLANLGFNITTLITGLGIGGMAVALASQAFLSDLFNYFSILIDRPFEIGDTIKQGEVYGEVCNIGIKGTRVKSVTGEMIIISNTDITKGALRNFQVMKERRVLANLGALYSTPAEKIERVPLILKEIVENIEGVRFGRAHFREFGDFSLIFELVYYVDSNNYTNYMDLQHLVNLEILKRFEREGINFAYPTQSIYLENRR